MDNCGCSNGSPFNNDNSLSGNMNMNNSMNNGMNNSMNNGMNGGMNLNMNSNSNNSNAALNNLGNSVQQLPNTNLQSNNVAASEILKAIAKNNIQQLNAEVDAEAEAESQLQQVVLNSSNMNDSGVKLNNNVQQSGKHSLGNMLLLALVVVVALAWNDAIKYYIGRMIKLNRSSPYMYLYYALIVTLVAVIAHNVVRNR
jgi:hypothetical protein